MIEPKCKEKVRQGEEFGIDFCRDCHYCSDPYECPIPHYLRHKFKIEHKEY